MRGARVAIEIVAADKLIVICLIVVALRVFEPPSLDSTFHFLLNDIQNQFSATFVRVLVSNNIHIGLFWYL